MLTRCPTCSAEYDSADTALTREGDWVCCPHCDRWSEVQLEERRRDQWTILTRDGRILSFASFEQVRTAFVVGLVEPDDRLLDEHGPSKCLTEVAELSTVLRAHRNTRKRTLPYAARVEHRSTPTLGHIRPASYSEWPVTTALPEFQDETGPATVRDIDDEIATLRPPSPPREVGRDYISLESFFDSSESPNEPPREISASPFPASEAPLTPDEVPSGPKIPTAPSPEPPPIAQEPARSKAAPVRLPSERVQNSKAAEPMQPAPSEPPLSEAPLTVEVDSGQPLAEVPKPQSALNRVFVIALSAAAGALLALTLPLSRTSQPLTPAKISSGSRDILQLERALHDGDFETALKKLADTSSSDDERAIVLRTRAFVERAEAEWLRIQALQANGQDVPELARTTFADQAEEARWAAHDLVTALGDRSETLVLELNALRVYGDIDRGRLVADRLAAEEANSEVLFALGAFDLVTPHADHARAVSRLQRAAPNLEARARVHALLTYALVAANDLSAASSELAKLERLARPHPALAELRKLLESRRTPNNREPQNTTRDSSGAGSSVAPKQSIQVRQVEAWQLKQRGQLASAEQIYRTILVARPGDCEALAGLGDIALRRGELTLARQYFEQALVTNNAYVPAWVALGDIAWVRGDRAAAVGYYRAIVARFAQGSYPTYVAERSK